MFPEMPVIKAPLHFHALAAAAAAATATPPSLIKLLAPQTLSSLQKAQFRVVESHQCKVNSHPSRLQIRHHHSSPRPRTRQSRNYFRPPACDARMSSSLVPSNPDDVMVIRNVTPNIATFSVPFKRGGAIPIGGRGTLVKLTSGSLAVFSPVALTEAAKAKVQEMGGNVAYIVALDYEHHIFISEWAQAFPDAKLVGVDGLPEKRAKAKDPKIGNEPFAAVFTKANKHELRVGGDFDVDFEYEYVDGHGNKEFVVLYKPERVLIEADLLFNLPATEQYSKTPEDQVPSNFVARAVFNKMSDPIWMKRLTWYLIAKDRASFNESVRRIDTWDFTTLIPCHGDVIEGNGKEKFRDMLQWHLEGKK